MIQLHLSLLLVLITCNTISFSYPTGAPISTCGTMKPGHGGVSPQPQPSPYMIKINSSSYQNGKAIQVQILGPPYKGLLLETRTQALTTLYGSWLQPPTNTKILACPTNTRGAITHSNAILKDQSTTYIWMPPSSDCPNSLFFIATVVQQYSVYWLEVKSALIYKAPAAACNNDNTGQLGFASVNSGMAWQPALYSVMSLQLVWFLICRILL